MMIKGSVAVEHSRLVVAIEMRSELPYNALKKDFLVYQWSACCGFLMVKTDCDDDNRSLCVLCICKINNINSCNTTPLFSM